jgi:hypothetical protein
MPHDPLLEDEPHGYRNGASGAATNLVGDLLVELGFSVEAQMPAVRDMGFDFKADPARSGQILAEIATKPCDYRTTECTCTGNHPRPWSKSLRCRENRWTPK